MADCLQTNGYELVVMGRNKDAVAKVLARGNASEASSPKELAEKSDIVQLCLTTSAVVEKIVYGDNGILAGIKKGSVLINFGTSIPASTQKIGAALAEKGAGMIDAPLGRTPAHAKDGLLNIMAAGDKATFDKYEGMLKEQGMELVLAHPKRYPLTVTKLKRLLADFKAWGGTGMEVASGNERPDHVRLLERLSLEFGLVASVGSDFHGPFGPWTQVGRFTQIHESSVDLVWRNWG